jgi:hypothetical protein
MRAYLWYLGGQKRNAVVLKGKTMDPVRSWYMEDRGRRAAEALRKRDFTAIYVENSTRAKEVILGGIPPEAVVGVGGSVTIREMKVLEDLKAEETKCSITEIPARSGGVFPNAAGPANLRCFLTGTNAITMDGQLVLTAAGTG